MKQCLRCGRKVGDKKLRCEKCIERVNEELEGKADREYQYYFRYHLKRIRHDYHTVSKMLKKYRKEK